jgi:Uma2 family endonuclease
MGEPGLHMDAEAYLAFERASDEKHELWDGEVFAMGGASLAHNWIVGNLVEQLGLALHGSGCKALPSDMRVRIPMTERYVYPDVTILCGPAQLEGEADVLLNPRTIIEVLSPSTAAFDRGEKFTGYRSIPSVQEILFVSQDRPRIEAYTRQADDSWVLREYREDDALPLAALATPLPLGAIYAGVSFA